MDQYQGTPCLVKFRRTLPENAVWNFLLPCKTSTLRFKSGRRLQLNR
jgi:hypothetical protein